MVKEAVQDSDSFIGSEIFRIKDPRVLTAQEHRLIGSTPDFRPRKYDPFKPQSFFDGSLSPEETMRIRREQDVIVSHSASVFFRFRGSDIRRYAVIIKLSEIDDSSGEVIERQPKLVGIYDEFTHETITDPQILASHNLTRAGMRRLLVEKRN